MAVSAYKKISSEGISEYFERYNSYRLFSNMLAI